MRREPSDSGLRRPPLRGALARASAAGVSVGAAGAYTLYLQLRRLVIRRALGGKSDCLASGSPLISALPLTQGSAAATAAQRRSEA